MYIINICAFSVVRVSWLGWSGAKGLKMTDVHRLQYIRIISLLNSVCMSVCSFVGMYVCMHLCMYVYMYVFDFSQTASILILSAAEPCDVFATFCVPEIANETESWDACIWPVGCQAGRAVESDFHCGKVNHFVHALPTRPETAAGTRLTQKDFENALDKACAANLTASSGYCKLLWQYMDWGYALVLTIDNGDCAPDTIAVHESTGRTPLDYKRTRDLIADTMDRLSCEHWFQTAFRSCQEWEPAQEDGAVVCLDAETEGCEGGSSSSSSSAPALTVDAPMGADAVPGLVHDSERGDAKLLSHVLAVDDMPPSFAPPPPSPMPDESDDDSVEYEKPEPPNAPLEPSDAMVLSWGMQRTSVRREKLEEAGGFDNWSQEEVENIIAVEELIRVRKE